MKQGRDKGRAQPQGEIPEQEGYKREGRCVCSKVRLE